LKRNSVPQRFLRGPNFFKEVGGPAQGGGSGLAHLFGWPYRRPCVSSEGIIWDAFRGIFAGDAGAGMFPAGARGNY